MSGLRAMDVMTTPIVKGAPLQEVLDRLDHAATVLVVDLNGRPVGVVSPRVAERSVSLSATVGDGMRILGIEALAPGEISVSAEARVADIARRMLDLRTPRLLVERAGAVVGLVSAFDLLRVVAAAPEPHGRRSPARRPEPSQ